ncbi:hypothetical protein [Siccirubricoccus deserti]|uniref:Uncharacterized protein n=1 Tax=Siccirubricoccus deserti TaxID=2013562 RepID=A0A9X0QWT8_9PROT|nr:hypothetical protein [Siccirubricoccus deserti]MBC4015436.1 hypothetical protein [Siccirubricoccus deserti]
MLTAGLGGMILGLALRPAPAPVAPPAESVQPSSPALTEQLAALRQAIATEQARLDALTRARVAAEAQLAAAQRDASQRDPAPREAGPREPTPRDVAREAAVREAQARREVAAVAAAPPARPARPEPAAALASGPRVFVHYRGGSPAAAEAASTAAALLRDSGFEVSDLRTVQSVPAQRVVRYFHAEDAGAAARLAGRLGRGWAIQDFRNFEPSPAPQTLEIWLPER